MNVYIYQAALLCEECGRDTRALLNKQKRKPRNPEDEGSYDSDDYPKGPYPDGGGKADCPQHCDQCSTFLENELTDEGWEYVKQAAYDYGLKARRGGCVPEWILFYDLGEAELKKGRQERRKANRRARRTEQEGARDRDIVLILNGLSGVDTSLTKK